MPPKALRPIGHDDRLSIVDHLDELRSRVFVCLAALAVAFGLCFWQNQPLLHLLNRALPNVSLASGQHGLAAVPDENAVNRSAYLTQAKADAAQAAAPGVSPAVRLDFLRAAQSWTKSARNLPKNTTTKVKPITIGVGEPFTVTLTVVFYFALLISLPVLLYEAYAFVIPALTPRERRIALPAMLTAPLLFTLGAVFAFFIVLTPAIHFLQGYNASSFDTLVQAKSLYLFEIMTMAAVGLAFQLPLGLLALQQAGIINSRTLTHQWRYAAVIIAVIAAALPGPDPVTTALETIPLIVLYLASIVLLKIADRRRAARLAAAETETFGGGLDPT
jgi:sec-independent protein translocase protein TatC